MKKRRFICFLIVTMFILGFLISDVAFGQSSKLIDHPTYKQTLLREDIRSLLPNFLNVFNGSETQKNMQPHHVDVLLGEPLFLRKLVPRTDNQFISLLYLDKDFRELFGGEQFYNVLKSSGEINKLLEWYKDQPPPPLTTPEPQPELEATRLSIVLGNNQSGETGKPLAQPLVVGVLDQNRKPLQGIQVTFSVTDGNGWVSAIGQQTDVYGQAQTTLTLGSRAGHHSDLVVARAAGITRMQTFAATATAPPPPKEPEPVVPVRSSTEEPPMYWIEGDSIYYRPTGGGKEIFHEPQSGTLTGGLAVDMGGGKVYWTEQTIGNMGRIQSADLAGSNVETVQEIFAVPRNIAVGTDKSGQRWVYWTTSNKRIHHINVDGSGFQGDFMEFPNSPTPPNHIAFDEKEHRLYWTEMGRIRGVAANGKGDRKLIVENLDELGGIAVADGVVYWTERTGDNLGKVGFRDLTGQNDKKLLAVLESIPEGIAVHPASGKAYWTTADGEIQSAPLTGAIQTVVTSEMRGAGAATGIALGEMKGTPEPPAAPSLSPVGSVQNTLLANYPNPFNPETWIPYQLSESADVSVSIYAVDGRLVRRLDLGHQVAGVYRSRSRAAYWDGRNEFGERVASGLYFYTLTAGDFMATRKMLIRK